ncbi:MAG: hypothetical protein KH295_03150 [Clostridiaceae bacterium]|nr:hypothetical protein [Clostridiaceae bacterium]
MTPLESLRLKPHHIAAGACGLDALALLSATGYCESGALPMWLYAMLAPALLAAGVVLYQITMRLYRDDRRRQRREQRAARLDKMQERRKAQ